MSCRCAHPGDFCARCWREFVCGDVSEACPAPGCAETRMAARFHDAGERERVERHHEDSPERFHEPRSVHGAEMRDDFYAEAVALGAVVELGNRARWRVQQRHEWALLALFSSATAGRALRTTRRARGCRVSSASEAYGRSVPPTFTFRLELFDRGEARDAFAEVCEGLGARGRVVDRRPGDTAVLVVEAGVRADRSTEWHAAVDRLVARQLVVARW